MKMRVVFVDDQPNVLAGLRRMLRSLGSEWRMDFVQSGEEALALIAESPIDVVVTDMRMPGMDGAQLLTKVMEQSPETVRIILSGQADEVSLMRSITPAHQYLSKPCDADTLRATVARACALRDTLNQASLKRLVSRVTSLPSLPDVYTSLLEELQSEDASVQRVAELISQDVGMSAKLLQLVNSSFFGIPRRIESPAHAAAVLGLNVLKPLVLSVGVFSQFDATPLKGYSLESLMEHSLLVSRLAEQLARAYDDNKELAEDALLAGLLHDVGQLVLVAHLPELYAEALQLAQQRAIPLCEAETECLGASHADVGAYLLGLWGLPDSIVEAVAFHHVPRRCLADGFEPLTAVHVANVLANESQVDGPITYDLDIDADYLEQLGVLEEFPKWRQMAQNFIPAGV